MRLRIIPVVLAAAVAVSGCDEALPDAQQKALRAAQARAATAVIYVPQNDVELGNYNKRQRIADDPSTIIWCTAAFPMPGSPFITMPIVGKLTSGNKRPYPTEFVDNSDIAEYYPEKPGPDHMFGSSGEYRFGFTPDGMYVDFYQIATFCTSQPMTWQMQKTEVIIGVDARMSALQRDAKQALEAGRRGTNFTPEAMQQAFAILSSGITRK